MTCNLYEWNYLTVNFAIIIILLVHSCSFKFIQVISLILTINVLLSQGKIGSLVLPNPLGAMPEQGGADGGADVSIDSIICGDTYWSDVADLNLLLWATSYTGNIEHNLFKNGN